MNGLKHANELLGYEAFVPGDWRVEGEYDEVGERHRAFVIPQKDLQVEGISLKRGEKVRIEESYKYNHEQAVDLFLKAGVVEGNRWINDKGTYGELHATPLSISQHFQPNSLAYFQHNKTSKG